MGEEREVSMPKGPLHQKLSAYGASDFYGFHMPGHKRHMGGASGPYGLDITEIHGFDDLHHPQEHGILAQAQARAAAVYGAEETHFLVNGSTAGVLSAISGCTRPDGELLLARNSHRSAYHGAALLRLKVHYLYPQILVELGINGGILPEDVDKSLTMHEGIEAVFVTSPTYEGVCLDVKAVAEICHCHGVPLIVDQAHGAHFPFSAYFPEDALRAGADVVIQSVHKTLPSLTQTALLHVQGDLVDRERLRSYLSVYQSSSPSYVLMASLDDCMELLEKKGEALFAAYTERLEQFRVECRDLRNLRLLGKELVGREGVSDFDRSRLVIFSEEEALTGAGLSRWLRAQAHLEMEMAAGAYVTGISSVADQREDFERLDAALHTLDKTLQEDGGSPQNQKSKREKSRQIRKAQAALPLWQALEEDREWVEADKGENRLSASYLYLYPPGIPLVVPGERLDAGLCREIKAAAGRGQRLHGLDGQGRIAVVRGRRVTGPVE